MNYNTPELDCFLLGFYKVSEEQVANPDFLMGFHRELEKQAAEVLTELQTNIHNEEYQIKLAHELTPLLGREAACRLVKDAGIMDTLSSAGHAVMHPVDTVGNWMQGQAVTGVKNVLMDDGMMGGLLRGGGGAIIGLLLSQILGIPGPIGMLLGAMLGGTAGVMLPKLLRAFQAGGPEAAKQTLQQEAQKPGGIHNQPEAQQPANPTPAAPQQPANKPANPTPAAPQQPATAAAQPTPAQPVTPPKPELAPPANKPVTTEPPGVAIQHDATKGVLPPPQPMPLPKPTQPPAAQPSPTPKPAAPQANAVPPPQIPAPMQPQPIK